MSLAPMFDRSYHTHDKTGWPPGPWHDEPDKGQWIDETTGLDCLIVRNHSGALCGYVGVPPDHPWHGVGYSDCAAEERDGGCDREWSFCDHTPEARVEVHGGLTFSGGCQPGEDESRGICHVPEPGRPDDVWWFGFDCAHAWDRAPGMEARERELGLPPMAVDMDKVYRDVVYVCGEVRRLARQLAARAPSCPACGGTGGVPLTDGACELCEGRGRT